MNGNGAACDPSDDLRREREQRSEHIRRDTARQQGRQLHRAVVNALAAGRQTR